MSQEKYKGENIELFFMEKIHRLGKSHYLYESIYINRGYNTQKQF